MAALYPDTIDEPTSTAFLQSQQDYWNVLQRQRVPACFFKPTNAEQIKTVILEIQEAECSFAIKGGGHSSNWGGSSIDGGLVVDLQRWDHVELAENQKSVTVGPGVHWGPLYLLLEKHGLMAVGGRDFGVGVPGFIFGGEQNLALVRKHSATLKMLTFLLAAGGLSNLGSAYGWGADNLMAVDIVLANGDLIAANGTSHPDLLRALHGGGAHNFGIVTSLTLAVHPLEGMWGGAILHEAKHIEEVLQAYDRYTKALAKDGKAHVILDFFRREGKVVAVEFPAYPELKADPPIYHAFRRVPSTGNTLRLCNNSDLAIEQAKATDATGMRNAYWTNSMEYEPELLKDIYRMWIEKTEVVGEKFHAALDYNHIAPRQRNQAPHMSCANVYGLEGPDEPLINVLLTMTWKDEEQDEEVQDLIRDIGNLVEVLARRHGKYRSFKYMNYANHEQDVIQGFGDKNKAFLKKVAAKYDPKGVFQKLQPGAFKLDKGSWDLSPRILHQEL